MSNFYKNEEVNQMLDYFGGKELLEAEYPAILRMLNDTEEACQQMVQNETEEEVGYRDTCRVEILPVKDRANSNKAKHAMPSVSARSVLSVKKPASFLQMTGTLTDPATAKVFGAFSVYDKEDEKTGGKHKLTKEILVDRTLFSYTNNTSVVAKTTFLAVTNVSGTPVCTLEETKEGVITIDDTLETIRNIEVIEPAPKNASDANIRVVYNGRRDSNAAYNFIKAKDRTIRGNRYVEVYYPFKVIVTLNDGYYFDKDNPVMFDSSFYLTLASEVVEGGAVHFNTALCDKIDRNVSDEEKKLTLSFPYSPNDTSNYWGVEMPLTQKQAAGMFDFHLNFTIHFYNSQIPGHNEYAAIVVSSESGAVSDNYRQVKRSSILWGCLGKDTLVRTESGQKKISEIQVGENIWTEKGFIPLKNMVTGTEEKIIAVAVDEEKVLYITEKHPIVTARGMIEAGSLEVGDQLKMEDGTFKALYYFETLDYNDKVFCPELAESACISAEGIMVGDYLTHSQEEEAEQMVSQPLDAELMEQLVKWTEMKDKQMKSMINAY